MLSNNHLTRLPRNRSAVFASSSLYYVIAKSILDMLVISNCRTHISILCCASSIPFIACFVFMVRYRWSFRNVTVNSNDHITIRLSFAFRICDNFVCLVDKMNALSVAGAMSCDMRIRQHINKISRESLSA